MSYFEGPHNLLRAQIAYFVNGTYNGITIASKFAGHADPPSVNFESPQAILRTNALGPTLS